MAGNGDKGFSPFRSGKGDYKEFEIIEGDAETARQERNAALLARGKSYEELLRPVECTVQSAHIGYYSHSFTPVSEMKIGGESPCYGAGQSAHLELRVLCQEHPVIQTLSFAGAAPLERGDRIRAYILKGEKKTLQQRFADSMRPGYHENLASVFLERDYTPEEKTSKIEKIDDTGEVLICYEIAENRYSE